MDIYSPSLRRWRVNIEWLYLLPVVNLQFRALINSYIVLVPAAVHAAVGVINGCWYYAAADTTVATAFCTIYKNLEFDSPLLLLAKPPCASSISMVVAVEIVMNLSYPPLLIV